MYIHLAQLVPLIHQRNSTTSIIRGFVRAFLFSSAAAAALWTTLLPFLSPQAAVVVNARRTWTSTGWNQEFSVTATLFENHQLNATECFKYYYTQPQIMNIARQPRWQVATVRISAYENGRRGVCGQCLWVRSTQDERVGTYAKIVGDCPTCAGNQVELTSRAFWSLNGANDVREVGKLRVIEAVYSFAEECPEEQDEEQGLRWPYNPRQLDDY
ncbi:hypothetical protein BGX29_007089 [Mortierella sp. GBA35]|nr:hypothetical protein BGX29_007089 [Mortierella sp. GBA35]